MGSNAIEGVPDVITALRGQPSGLIKDEEAVVLVEHAALQLTGNGSALGVKLPTCRQAQASVTALVASPAGPTQPGAGWVRVVHRLGQARVHPACVTCSCMESLKWPEKVETASFLCSLSRMACLTSCEVELAMSDLLPCSHLLWCGGLCTRLQNPPPPLAQAAARPLPAGLFWSRFSRCHLLG